MSGKYEVKVDIPSAGDVELDVAGVAIIRNKKSAVVILTDEQYEMMKDSENVTVKKVSQDREAVNEPDTTPVSVAPEEEMPNVTPQDEGGEK